MTKEGKTLSQAEKKVAKDKKIAERAAERAAEQEAKAKMWAAATLGDGDDTSAGKKLSKKEIKEQRKQKKAAKAAAAKQARANREALRVARAVKCAADYDKSQLVECHHIAVATEPPAAAVDLEPQQPKPVIEYTYACPADEVEEPVASAEVDESWQVSPPLPLLHLRLIFCVCSRFASSRTTIRTVMA
jgi:colicin import membrane protein